jgi:FkbM family methyltransferase
MNKQAHITADEKLKDLKEENKILLLQLHQVQEELEGYFVKCKELESGGNSGKSGKSITSQSTHFHNASSMQWVDDELPEALAEVDRLATLVAVQAEVNSIASNKSLNVMLGNLLLESSRSISGIIKLPFSLIGFWRNISKKTPPAQLGGNDFTAVIKAYNDKGFPGVEDLLKDDKLSPFIKGNAYTALARHLMKINNNAAAESASKAYAVDPKPYRLKWLAFRIHEASDAKRAEALLQLLPNNINYTDSELRQVDQARYEAACIRIGDAKKATQIISKQEQVKKALDQLKYSEAKLQDELAKLGSDRDSQAQLAQEQADQIKGLKCSEAKLQDELKKLRTVKQNELKVNKMGGGEFGNLLKDLVPFFYGRNLTYVDIGAYIGDVFLAFADSELKIREAHLVEPNSQSYQNLLSNTLNYSKVNLHHYCLAIDERPGQLLLSADASMTRVISAHNTMPSEEFGKDKLIVESTTIDILIDRITENHIDILKIDVEGFEENVLRGAQNTLNKQLVDMLIIEVGMNPNGQQQCYYRIIDDLLIESGYRIFRIYEQKHEWMTDLPFMRRANFVYMSNNFAKSNPYKLTQELYKKDQIIKALRFEENSN